MPEAAKFLFSKENGEAFVAVKSETLGLKSKVSVALIPPSKIGISLLNLSSS